MQRMGWERSQSRRQQSLLAFAHGLAKAEDDGLFLRADGEKNGAKKRDDHQHHDDLDDRKAAEQRLGQRLRTGVQRSHRLRPHFDAVWLLLVLSTYRRLRGILRRVRNRTNISGCQYTST